MQNGIRPAGAVVVTGASTGIARATALKLVASGYTVFATVRSEPDARSLEAEAGGGLIALLMDVAVPESIAAAAAVVRDAVGTRGLAGLVNNAGVGFVAPVEYLDPARLRYVFEVNVYGQVEVTQRFLPLVREGRGRIVNIGSVGDRITVPFGGMLCGSKAAFAAITDALRMELHPWGIHVCLVEPGSIHTPAVDKTLGDAEAVIGALPPEGASRYAEMFRGFTRQAHKRESGGSSPDVVAEVVLHALASPRPRTRYPVGKDSRLLTTLPRVVPEATLDRLRLRIFGMPVKFGALNPTPAN